MWVRSKTAPYNEAARSGRPDCCTRLALTVSTCVLLRERLKLDSGYLSRLLRSLEAQGLVQTDAQASDGRVRRVILTPRGVAERSTYDALSNDLA